MNSNFLKFKRRARSIQILKASLAGLASGLFFGGGFLLLSRLALIETEPIIALPIGIGALAIAFAVTFLALLRSDLSLAKRLDRDFSLNERVQTMVESKDGDSAMLRIQREDADKSLAKIKIKSFKARRLWIYIIALILGACLTATAFIVPNRRDEMGEKDVPFALSDMQRAGLLELIAKVKASDMQEQYRTAIAGELEELILELDEVEWRSEMQALLTESMAYILDITYDSSSTSEILDTIWKSGNFHLKHLAFALNPNDWENENPWGVFLEKLADYEATICSDTESAEDAALSPEEKVTKLKSVLDTSAIGITRSLGSSKIAGDDALRVAIQKLATYDGTDSNSYTVLKDIIPTLTYDEAKEEVGKSIDAFAGEIFSALETNKKNADMGEYTITKLSTLFLVPTPEFERPDFVKYQQTIGDENGNGDNKENEGGSEGGGVGEGSIFGSTDLVLDYLTGEYVEYGTLLDRYYAVVFEKLQNGSYSDEQKEMIENYFALLYGGIKKEEGK